VPLAAPTEPLTVSDVPPAEIDRVLEWRPRLLDFESTPLTQVVETFNRRNTLRLVIADASLNDLPVVASIRSDNVEGFVRLLEATMGVRSERTGANEIMLRRAR
jgi:transmembrane sensor